MPMPINVIHAALMHTGKVVCWGGTDYSSDTVVWNPADPNPTAFNLIPGAVSGIGGNRLTCAGMTHLQDGKVLAVGGDAPTRATGYKFNPTTEHWEPAGTMNYVRWYPTCVTLGDDSGRVLIVGGSTFNGGPPVPEMEIYNQTTDTYDRVWGPLGPPSDTSADRELPKLYGGMHLLPNGQIFHTRVGDRDGGPGDRSANFTFTALDRGQWSDVTTSASDIDRIEGMAVLVLKQTPTDPDRVLVVGGQGTNTIAVVEVPATAGSTWLTGTFLDGIERANVNAVALPDGSVFILGGLPPSGTPTTGGACMLYRPPVGAGLGTLTAMSSLSFARQHHSVALLLPNAKVVVMGGSSNVIEQFSPPYLFDALGNPLPESARPNITTFPDPSVGTEVYHASTFTLGTSTPAANIDRVVMVKPIAATHQTDSEQRVIRLEHTVTGANTISVTAPDGRVYPYGVGGGHTHAIAGRGYYMLFLRDTAGVVGNAKFIKLV